MGENKTETWSKAAIGEYRDLVDAARQEVREMEAGGFTIYRQDAGGGPPIDTTAATIESTKKRIELLEKLIAVELRRGMEPTPHLKVDRDGAIAYFIRLFGGMDAMKRDARIDATIAVLAIDQSRGDELWVCRSRYIGPMAGHEGLGSVRKGKILRYEAIIDY